MDEQQQPRFERPSGEAVVLWGNIATVHFRVSIPEIPGVEERLWGLWHDEVEKAFYEEANL